MVLNRH